MASDSKPGYISQVHRSRHAQFDPANPGRQEKYVSHTRTAKSNARINLKAVAEVLAEEGLDPTVELVKIVRTGKLPIEVQARTLTTLMEFYQPKRKAVEVSGIGGGPIKVERVSDEDLLKIALQSAAVEAAEDVEARMLPQGNPAFGDEDDIDPLS